MRLRVALAILAGLLAAPSANAFVPNSCAAPHGCLLTPDPWDSDPWMDYTMEADGKNHFWNFLLVGPDPNAVFYLGAPNQVDRWEYVRTETGYDTVYLPFGDMTGIVISGAPAGRYSSRLHYQVPANFFDCDKPGPVGQICGRFANVWGDATGWWLNANAPMTLYFSEDVFDSVPEPSSWATALLGFLIAGTAMCRRRSAGTVRVRCDRQRAVA